MGVSILSMFVLLSIFVLALSLILLFFLNVALPAHESDNPFILGNFEVEVGSLEEVLGIIQFEITMFIMSLQYDVMLMQFYGFFYSLFSLPQNFYDMITGVLMFTASFMVFEWAIGPRLLRRSLSLKRCKNPWLTKTVRELAKKSGVRKPQIAIWPTKQPNAFVFGRTAKSATLVVSEGLLKTLNREEIRAIIGHEIGHLKHRDYLVMTCLNAIPVLCYIIVMSTLYGSLEVRYAIVLFPTAIFAFIVYISTLIIIRSLSRQREFYSDVYSAYLTENPRGLKSALTKIAYGLSVNPKEVHGARALFIEDPANAVEEIRRINKRRSEYDLDKDGTLDERELEKAMEAEARRTRWIGLNNLFSTHPPTYKRILLLSQIEKEMATGKYSGKNIYMKI